MPFPVKLPIALRLFFAVVITAITVTAAGLWMLNEEVQRGFNRYVTEVELIRLSPLAAALEQTYKSEGSWPAITEDARKGWLKQTAMRLRNSPSARYSGMFPEGDRMGPPPDFMRDGPSGHPGPHPPNGAMHWGPPPRGMPPDRLSLHDRAGLLDANGNYLAGMPSPPEAPRRELTVAGKLVGYLTLVEAVDPVDALAKTFLADQTRDLLIISAICIGLSALAAALLAAHFRGPIRTLVHAAEELTLGRFHTRINSRRSDELGTLAQSFNHLAFMLERHEASRRQWVADTSHELRTPVAVLRAQIEALQDGVREPNPAQFAAMQRQVVALGTLIDELHELARADVGQLTYRMVRQDPWALIEAEAEGFRDRFQAAGLRLRLDAPHSRPELLIDANRLRQVIANLLENSLRYTDAGGEVALSAHSTPTDWICRVDDSSPGVSDEDLSHLGERFFRVEQSRNRALGGTGLGLALCQRIAEAHGGKLGFSHSPLGGLCVELHIRMEEKA